MELSASSLEEQVPNFNFCSLAYNITSWCAFFS